MNSINKFNFCPNCGSKNIKTTAGIHWTCPDCGYDLYNNDAAAVGILLVVNGKLLVFSRTKEPQKGKLGLPGGFVNKGESLEEAAVILKDQTVRSSGTLRQQPKKSSIISKFKLLLPLFVPLFIRTLQRAESLAEALDARYYGYYN